MKKRVITKLIVLLSILIMVGLVAYMYIFNSHGINVTMGLKSDEIFKAEDKRAYTYEALILLSDSKNQYEEVFGNEIWNEKIEDKDFSTYVKDQVKSKLIRVKIMNIMAEKRGVVLSREEENNIAKAASDYMKLLSDEQKNNNGITVENVTQMYREFAVAQRLYDDLTINSTTEISSDEARVITIQYIACDSLESCEAAKARLDAGETFFYVARDTNKDEKYEYELKRGDMEKAFEDAAFELASGETSGIVEAKGKFYIIKCVSDYEKTKSEANKTKLLEAKKLQSFNDIFEQYEADVYVEMNDKVWDNLTIEDGSKLSKGFDSIFNNYYGK